MSESDWNMCTPAHSFQSQGKARRKIEKLLGSKVCVCEEKRVWTWEWG